MMIPSENSKRHFYDLEELRTEVFDNRLSKAHIYNSVKRGEIETIKIGGRLLVPATWVNKLIRA